MADLLSGLAILALSLIGWSQLDEILDFRMTGDVGPALLPTVYVYGLGVCGLILVGVGVWRYAHSYLGNGGEKSDSGLTWSWDRLKAALQPMVLPAMMAATVAAFIKVVPAWGFLYTSFAFLGFWLIFFAWRDEDRPVWIRLVGAVLGAAAIAGLFYGVFRFLIKVPLP
ncbi:MAG: tripartite tricarboxylate transporter TctB family protein [Candidatus Bipolaricaulia bacterium]